MFLCIVDDWNAIEFTIVFVFSGLAYLCPHGCESNNSWISGWNWDWDWDQSIKGISLYNMAMFRDNVYYMWLVSHRSIHWQDNSSRISMHSNNKAITDTDVATMQQRHALALKQLFSGDESGCSAMLGQPALQSFASSGSSNPSALLASAKPNARQPGPDVPAAGPGDALKRLLKGVKDPITAAAKFRKSTLRQWTHLTNKALPQALDDCKRALAEIDNDFTSEEIFWILWLNH